MSACRPSPKRFLMLVASGIILCLICWIAVQTGILVQNARMGLDSALSSALSSTATVLPWVVAKCLMSFFSGQVPPTPPPTPSLTGPPGRPSGCGGGRGWTVGLGGSLVTSLLYHISANY